MSFHPLLPEIEYALYEAKIFQREDAYFAAQHGRVMLGHKVGLGKTLISILTWSYWPSARKVLIIGTLSSIAVWKRLLMQWAGAQGTFIQGYSDPEWKRFLLVKEGIFMCTYATLHGLMKKTPGRPVFDLLICDELHQVLRNRNNIYKSVARLQSEYFLGLSGTWASRGPQDLYPVLNIIDRKTFSSYWRFAQTWCYVERTPFGTEIFGVRNKDNLVKMLRGKYFVARSHEEVAQEFGIEGEPVIRRVVSLPMSTQQAELHTSLDRDMVAELGETTVVTPTVLAKLTRLLQLSICPPILFPGSSQGGAIDWLLDQIEEEPHTVVFCPFKEVLKYLETLLVDKSKRPFMLSGGMDPDEVNQTIDRWKQVRGTMLCTISFAQAFSLDTVNVAHMLGFDWDPNNNMQAEGRLRRLDSILKNPCIVNYIVMEGTAYEEVKDVVNDKVATTQQFLYRRIKGIGPSKDL